MGAIVGVFAYDRRAAEHPAERRMQSASLLPRGDADIATSGVSGVTVWFDGRLDNRHDFARLLGPGSPLDETSDAALVLAAYLEHHEDVARHLNGDFAIAIVDRRRGCAVLARDVMASRPLFYCETRGCLLFATEIKCLLAHPDVTAAVDVEALAELVLDHWCDEHRTCFKNIFSVPPGHAVVATAGRVERRVQWAFDPMRRLRYRSFEDYRDHFRVLFEQAVRRRLRGAGSVAVTVSGGLDSSSIYCQAAELQQRESPSIALHGISLTFPAGTPADEQRFLEDVERRWQRPITRVPVAAYHYLEATETMVRHLDAPGTLHREQVALFENARRAGCRVMLSGFFGDQLLAGTGYLLDLARGRRWLTLRRHVRTLCAWTTDVDPAVLRADVLGHLVRAVPPRWLFRLAKRVVRRARRGTRYPPWFTPSFCRQAEARALTRFDCRLPSATAHAERCHLHAWAGHYTDVVRCEVAAARAYGLDVRYPFRDRDLIEFLMAIPGEIVNWHGVPKGLLRHALAGVIPDAIRDRRSKADFTWLENDASRRDAVRVAPMITPDAASVRAGIVDAAAGDRLAAAYARDMTDDSSPLPGWRPIDVAAVELWFQQHFGQAASRAAARVSG